MGRFLHNNKTLYCLLPINFLDLFEFQAITKVGDIQFGCSPYICLYSHPKTLHVCPTPPQLVVGFARNFHSSDVNLWRWLWRELLSDGQSWHKESLGVMSLFNFNFSSKVWLFVLQSFESSYYMDSSFVQCLPSSCWWVENNGGHGP